ncbi:MAG TPA: prolyl oligopeptidase family serine peptidase [Chloroflexota bacterium]|jgi:dienelactone hydrolase
MYYFFADNYMWSQAVLRALFTGANPGEVLQVVEALQDAAADYDAEAWYAAWRAQGERLLERAEREAADEHRISARESFLRASCYLQWAIPFTDHEDPRRREVHTRSLDAFGRYAALNEPPIERVEVPYEGTTFPAWFVPAAGAGPKPAVYYLPGWDSTKEQGIELALALRPRGFHTLLCDGPGIGEAVLFRGMVNRHDYEVPGAAAFDYLASRPDVDAGRIAVVGASMGGYRAGRVAAFEHRLAAAVVWGAVWDYRKVWAMRRSSARGPVPTPQAHALFVMGARDFDEVGAKLEAWHLSEVAQQIQCPLLLLHGHDDAQIAVEDAYRMYEAAGSAQKELKVFTAEEGGAAHCQNDNRQLAHDYLGDWLVDTLLRGKARQGVIEGEPVAAGGRA